MENIELFNKYTGICLTTLYKSFPVPVEIVNSIIVEKVIGLEETWERDDVSAVVSNIEINSENYPNAEQANSIVI